MAQAPPIGWSPLGSLVYARQAELQGLSSAAPPPLDGPPQPPTDDVGLSPREASLPFPPVAAEAVALATADAATDGVGDAAGAGVGGGGTLSFQRWAFDGHVPPAVAEAVDVASYSGDALLSMRWRALHAYGLEAAANVSLLSNPIASSSAAEQRQLLEAWRWLARAAPEAEGARALEARLEGACASLLHDSSTHLKSSSGLGAYSSPARVRVLRSCGWEVCAGPPRLCR